MNDLPVYDWEGHLLQHRSLSSIESMLKAGLVTVERGKRGNIKWAVRKTPAGDPAVSRRLPVGMRTSYIERLPSGRRVWSFA